MAYTDGVDDIVGTVAVCNNNNNLEIHDDDGMA